MRSSLSSGFRVSLLLIVLVILTSADATELSTYHRIKKLSKQLQGCIAETATAIIDNRKIEADAEHSCGVSLVELTHEAIQEGIDLNSFAYDCAFRAMISGALQPHDYTMFYRNCVVDQIGLLCDQ